MGQILALPFYVQKLPGFRFGTFPPDPLTGGTRYPAGARCLRAPRWNLALHSLCNVSGKGGRDGREGKEKGKNGRG